MQPSGRDFVIATTLADPVCAAVLEWMPALGLTEWWLTAGAVFQNVWNALSGMAPGAGIKDYDVFYFDESDLSWEAEDRVIRAAAGLFADIGATIEVRNEARVHLWYEERFGKDISPFASARDAVDSFAATACCVGLTRDGGDIDLYTTFGLDDTIAMHLKPNPRIAPRSVYETKATQYQTRWPQLTFDPWDPEPRLPRSR
jgi:hypothetical protein